MANLYESILSLCVRDGIRPGRLCDELGISRGLMTDLKMGRKKGINAETAQKIASFFGVSVDELFSDSLEIKVDPTKDNKTKSVQLFVPLISMFGVFFLASIVFFIMKLMPSWSEYAYYPLIYSVPLASVVMIVFSAIWWNLRLKCVCVSALIWSGAVAVYFTIQIESMKYIFIICTVLQAVCILSFLFRHFFTKK